MDFYDKKIQAKTMIKNLLKAKGTLQIDEIVYILGEKFGFGTRFVETEISLLENIGYCKKEGSFVRWIDNETKDKD